MVHYCDTNFYMVSSLIPLLSLQGEVLGLDPREVNVPVIGGHAGVTILPLLSQVRSNLKCYR